MSGVRRVLYRLPELAEATRLFHVEGEGCADALVRLGLRATTTAGGAQSWRDEFADQAKAAAVPEIIVLPDRDAPGETYATNTARGYASRGLHTKVLHLPDLAEHGDVVDWIAARRAAGLDDSAIQKELERLADEAPMFDASPAPAEPAPTITMTNEDGTVTWPDGATISFARVIDGTRGVSAEVTVTFQGRELEQAVLNLLSPRSRDQLARKLETLAPAPWGTYLDVASREMVRRLRQGAPIVVLEPRVHDLKEQHAVAPIMPRGQTALAYTMGGGGKSLLANLLGIGLVTKKTITTFAPNITGNVLFLDWESTQDEHETRLALLCAGLRLDTGAIRERIFYRPMAGRLSDEISRVRQDVARHRIVAVFVDSVVPAAGPDAEGAEAAVRLMTALRTLGPEVSRLLLGHVTKSDFATGGPTYPFGSVFYWNLSRSVFELRADEEADHLRLSFTHKKCNNGPKAPTFGLDYHFQADRIVVTALSDLADRPNLTRSAPLPERFLLALRASASLTTKEMAATLQVTEAVAGAVGRRLHNDKKAVVKLPLVPPADDGSTFKWALATRQPEPTA
ncbi:MAG: hypothetical protein A2W08_11790 [Candidatus Rokubacteria bacterium RBG_16_73_20]|nr:MAG: hypothetical protein A2W08_11790 [Candidatus Rokubacteria bacterium RBG_16_73_20]